MLVFAAPHQSWNVWLIGSSNRWAAGAILLLGIAACSLGTAGEEMGRQTSTRVPATIGLLALVTGLRGARDGIAHGSLAARRLHGRALGRLDGAQRVASDAPPAARALRFALLSTVACRSAGALSALALRLKRVRPPGIDRDGHADSVLTGFLRAV